MSNPHFRFTISMQHYINTKIYTAAHEILEMYPFQVYEQWADIGATALLQLTLLRQKY